jgi:hypothetical protein
MPLAVASVVASGGGLYLKMRTLWPIVVAHTAIDLFHFR